jgi:hypothetical protein
LSQTGRRPHFPPARTNQDDDEPSRGPFRTSMALSRTSVDIRRRLRAGAAGGRSSRGRRGVDSSSRLELPLLGRLDRQPPAQFDSVTHNLDRHGRLVQRLSLRYFPARTCPASV